MLTNVCQKQLPKTTAQSSPSLAEKEKTKYHRMAECRFAVHCFFDDLHCIQEFLHETWKSFKAGNIDLVTAMITTTAAVDTVRLRERSLLDSAIVRETIASKNPSHEIETSKLGYQCVFPFTICMSSNRWKTLYSLLLVIIYSCTSSSFYINDF